MKIGNWYRIAFSNGDELFFRATAEQKNGGLAGVSYMLYVDRPRAKAKPKKTSVSRFDRRMEPGGWRWISEDQVPFGKFAS